MKKLPLPPFQHNLDIWIQICQPRAPITTPETVPIKPDSQEG